MCVFKCDAAYVSKEMGMRGLMSCFALCSAGKTKTVKVNGKEVKLDGWTPTDTKVDFSLSGKGECDASCRGCSCQFAPHDLRLNPFLHARVGVYVWSMNM